MSQTAMSEVLTLEEAANYLKLPYLRLLRSQGRKIMEVHELVIEMKLLERRMTLYEEKYGVLSEDFYAALMAGELAEYDVHDESRADFSRWKGIYETWKRRKEAYRKKLQERELAELLRFQPAY
jgi:hypothetical protein